MSELCPICDNEFATVTLTTPERHGEGRAFLLARPRDTARPVWGYRRASTAGAAGGGVIQAKPRTRIKTRKTKRRSLRTYSDTLWSRLIKILYGNACFYCKGTSGIQSAHIIGRSHMATRYHLKNGIALCARDHRAFDTYALDRDKLIVMAIGVQAYEQLKLAAQKPWDKTYPTAALRQAIAALRAA